MGAYAATDRLLTETFGHPAHRLDGEALLSFEPALKPGLAGGWYYDGDAHLRPDVLLRSWRESLERAGVSIVENARFDAFRRRDGRAEAAVTDRGEFAAGSFVVSTGAWTPRLDR